MNHNIEKIKNTIAPLRDKIINHKVYGIIENLDDLKIFMQYHVYAVWDFMSLLKSLQNSLTCITIPWYPKGSADNRYLINEIVVGEESDLDPNGLRKSHFEIYLDAMQQCGANTYQINTFISVLKNSNNLNLAFSEAETPLGAQNFVNFTFDVINSNKNFLQSAIFTFGREDLIPGMFISIVNDMHKKFPNSISIFKYYLDRHIEIDGDHHSQLALKMTDNLCENNPEKWNEAEKIIVESLHKRIELWDSVYLEIKKRNIDSNAKMVSS